MMPAFDRVIARCPFCTHEGCDAGTGKPISAKRSDVAITMDLTSQRYDLYIRCPECFNIFLQYVEFNKI